MLVTSIIPFSLNVLHPPENWIKVFKKHFYCRLHNYALNLDKTYILLFGKELRIKILLENEKKISFYSIFPFFPQCFNQYLS